MSKKIKLVNQVRIWSFIICFASGGLLILDHFGHLGFDRILPNEFWQALEVIIGFSIVTGIVTTFIALINNASNGLYNLQKKKETEKNKNRP
ncbi:hypothetical protein [Vreelandella sp.]|uniref:hypothetical protein n=1 Tax=Vreelandella sp. TaxID=3137778 RepID=UPI003BACBDDA